MLAGGEGARDGPGPQRPCRGGGGPWRIRDNLVPKARPPSLPSFPACRARPNMAQCHPRLQRIRDKRLLGAPQTCERMGFETGGGGGSPSVPSSDSAGAEYGTTPPPLSTDSRQALHLSLRLCARPTVWSALAPPSQPDPFRSLSSTLCMDKWGLGRDCGLRIDPHSQSGLAFPSNDVLKLRNGVAGSR
jgi:hypothetical protein